MGAGNIGVDFGPDGHVDVGVVAIGPGAVAHPSHCDGQGGVGADLKGASDAELAYGQGRADV